MYFVGIDPGSQGGIVILSERGYVVYKEAFGRCDRIDILQIVRSEIVPREDDNGIKVYIEKVGGFIGGTDEESKKKNIASAHTMFIFGQQYERIMMALAAFSIPAKEVLPKIWQKFHKIKKRPNEGKPQFKARLQALAKCKTGSRSMTLQVCDAYLIADYCYHMEKPLVENIISRT